jgi:NAD(P)-dependent dehydrogenase (short-subunit alcohol dehydrogenase family)
LADINPKGAAQTAKLIKAEFPDVGILEVVVDVTDENSVYAMVDEHVDKFGTLDCGMCCEYRALPLPEANV